ncbi:polysaccharide deacetylase family protein, PEP-CTERM locus subfamily [Fodinibius roseus]|uniref:Polysaccharide deacetylase family protein, PEP-CTERM locus subfamily n=1 Tax=Fodinibius roseus TaxID=1194090 RepID=A0A1M4SRD1_9BACT|nr:polysaccharide deacetylase family protein [Fodinibius roseus]SHE34731.1 polysaccharide deacetylase family protein, PEP-CTERM locus subfamily [Fodinibius roseus]
MRDDIKSAFTVDVEDGVSIAMRDAFSVQSEQTRRVVSLTEKILNLLDKYEVKGTFFVLGQVAEKFPELIKQISEGGHELGVHGYNHLQFFRMTREKAFEEISSAKKLIEDISGKKVFGHRAPAFSITPETRWGLDVIAEAGFTYDSSIMPINGIRYGWPGFSREISRIKTPSGYELTEVPMSTIELLGRQIPVCGGGYLRIYPEWVTKKAFERIIKNRSAIIYLHPYELDTERYPDYYFKELDNAGFLKRNKMKFMWYNRSTVYPKLSSLLENYEFDTVINLVRERKSQHEPIEI